MVVVDSVGDDGVGEDEVLSDDDDLDEYLKEADELVSPHANVSNRTEMTSLGNLDETVPVQDDDVAHPARNKAKETFAQKAARKALERQEKERRSKSRRLNQ